jgi:hypothetical protein
MKNNTDKRIWIYLGRELISILRQFFKVGDYSKLRIRTSYFE